MEVLLGVYFGGFISSLLLCIFGWLMARESDTLREAEIAMARSAFFTPVWPLLCLYWIGVWLSRMWKVAWYGAR